MGVRIISDADGAVIYCSTTGWAFGPVFEDHEQAEDFLEWLPGDARKLTEGDLRQQYNVWHDRSFNAAGEFTPDLRDLEPTDNEVYNRPGVEGGVAYSLTDDSPGSLGENDWRL